MLGGVAMKWILTDCFDTLLLRKYDSETVKRKWAKNISALMDYTLPYQKIYEIRKISESVLPSYYTLWNLYDEIVRRIQNISYYCGSCSYRFQADDIKRMMYQTEFKCELNALQVNEDHLNILKKSTARKAIISDMYCGSGFIWALLREFGIDNCIEKVFVSCDYRASKLGINVSLYDKALDELKISPEEVVTYDDNEVCLIRAKQHKIRGIKVSKHLYHKAKNDHKHTEARIRRIMDSRYGSMSSLQNYSALFYLFTERLYKQCIKDKIEELFFLSREGEFLKKMFDTYCAIKSGEIITKYMFVSRRAILSACFSSDPFQPGENIVKIFRVTSVRNILENIGFTENEIENARLLTNSDFDKKIENYWESNTWKILCSNVTFFERFVECVERKKNDLMRYLDQIGFRTDKRIAIVDVGWKGTMQDALRIFVDGTNGLKGYYLGLTEYTDNRIDNEKKGLIFSASEGFSEDYEIWSFYHTQLESILTASHAGVKSYTISNKGKVSPVFQDWGTERLSYQMMSPIQDMIMKKFNDIYDTTEQFGYDGEDFYLLFLRTYIKTVLTMGRKKSNFFKKLQYNQIDNIGSGKSNSATMFATYNLMHNMKRVFANLNTIKYPVRMIRILQTNNLHFLIPCAVHGIKKQFLKQIKYRDFKVE